MDWATWLYGLLAVVIALLLSSVELLTRYRNRRLQEIFFSRYYGFFALLNAFFCSLVYLALPHLSQVVIKTESVTSVDPGLLRAVVSGLGYLVIARTSILDITIKEGATYGIGFDGIYNSLAQYLLDHHRRHIRKVILENFRNIHEPGSADERQVFRHAARLVRAGLDTPEERTAFDARFDLAEANFPHDAPDYCFTLYQLLLDYTTGPQQVQQHIQRSRTEIARGNAGNPEETH